MIALLLAILLQAGPLRAEWVVSFQHTTKDESPSVTMNIRFLVVANSEGEAALVAMKRLRKVMDDRFCDELVFLEAQERKAGK